MALSTAGQYFSWSGVSCNAAFARSILMSVSVFRSAAFNRSGVAEEVCALAIGDAVRKSAVVPATTIFNIGDLLGELPPGAPHNGDALRRHVDLDQGTSAASGTKLPKPDVRSTVAIWDKPDMAQTA